MSNYRTLDAWIQSRALVREIYQLTSTFPRSEMFGLVQQMRRAAGSIPSNIAEGHGRWTRRDCIRFLHIARGSAFELDTQLFLAEDLSYIDSDAGHRLREKTARVAQMINGLIRYYAALRSADHEARSTKHEARTTKTSGPTRP
jgi:four helix bundle protein